MGHCSNAGGHSAVRRHQLYSNRRIRVFAANKSPLAYTQPLTTAFMSPAAMSATQLSQKHIRGGPVKDVASIPSRSSAHVAPATCPTCQSSAIVTKAKSPDADSYWRCTKCGEIWHASRTVTNRHHAYRWR